MYIGCHLSISRGYSNAIEAALKIGANVFQISIPYYNFHPGNHLGQGKDYAIERISEALNEIITGREVTMILLETMAGKGTEIGSTFQELRAIIDRVKYSELVGVCLDTCHIYSAGYDIVNNLDGVLEEFDYIIGLENLRQFI